ncbi:MAG: hypothetical protein RIB53_17215 [Roseitalea porphyridii]|jgi:hypothetical protein|uniref:hypothetical protein n=1 Tax=Roseitalea porphyridii TaxID=1852022 RepID=UPI0032EA9D86
MDITHPESITLSITLDPSTFFRAARLGGLPITLDGRPIDDIDTSMQVIALFAHRGITAAIQESFDRAWPAHYPEDCDDRALDRTHDAGTGRPTW